MNRIIITLIAILASLHATSQESEIQEMRTETATASSDSTTKETSVRESLLRDTPLSVSLELATRYVWRGLQYGDAPVAFATLGYTYKGFYAYAMGAYAFNSSHQEVDLGVTYTWKWLTIGASDYFFPSAAGEKDKYFNFNRHTTGHSIETYITASPFSFPLWITASVYPWGNDYRPDGKQAYSAYAEIGYKYRFKGPHAISAICGAALNKSFYNDYTTGFSIVNVSARYDTAFRFGSFELPVSASYILNPWKGKSYFTLSLYFNV